jgi:glycosyltransferase involved in cell wall biosynthesis
VKLSVVIPAHGRRELVERTVRSLARQEDPPPAEAIVVDDGADPGLGDHLRALALPIDLRVLHLPENRGRAAARNAGIAAAGGDVVVFLDSDMDAVPGFLAAHARAHGEAGVVALGDIRTAPEVAGGAFVEYIDSRGVKKVREGEEIPWRYFMTGNSSVAAGLLARAGGFDEEFSEYGGEDTEMGYRLGACGGRFRFARGAVSLHLDLNTVPRMAERLRRYGERMLPVLVRKVPTAREDLGLYLAEPARAADGLPLLLRKAACAVACRRTFWGPAAVLGQALPRGLRADALYDFVRAAAYLDGYRAALRSGR